MQTLYLLPVLGGQARPPLLSGRGHPVAVPCLSYLVIFSLACARLSDSIVGSSVKAFQTSSDLLHSAFRQSYVYYTVNWQWTLFKVLIAWKSVDCPIFSLHEVFLHDKLTLDHAQWIFLVILY